MRLKRCKNLASLPPAQPMLNHQEITYEG
jgi:hypothetical protein